MASVIYFNDGPKLLIDAATCEGKSGSAVYVRERECNRLLGIYTGRTSQLNELGFVFTPEAVVKIIHSRPIGGRLQYNAVA